MTAPTVLDMNEWSPEEYLMKYGIFAEMYMLYLGVKDIKDIVSWYDFRNPEWDGEEAEDYHEDFKMTARLDDAVVCGMGGGMGLSIGLIEFGMIGDEKVIYEQNASPLMCWRKRREGEL